MDTPGFYETDRSLVEYLLFHYGTAEQVLPWSFGPANCLNYPVRCVSECLQLDRLPPAARALDLGCATGRSTFELARHCTAVIGIDRSHRFIQAAQGLQQRGSLAFTYPDEGDLSLPAHAVVPAEIDRARVGFEQGDAEALRPDLGSFDVVLMANLLDRLADPQRCLEQMPRLVRSGGQMIITTPCTWLETYTPRAQWLGGYTREGQPVRTLDTLRRLLEPTFRLSRSTDLCFLIREHARKFQWSVALATVWLKP
jgi:putative 4-mercaptohistidine N1-methyltranferase